MRLEVADEAENISRETSDLALCHEGVDLHGSIQPLEKGVRTPPWVYIARIYLLTLNRFQVCPARFGVAMGEPVALIGPAPVRLDWFFFGKLDRLDVSRVSSYLLMQPARTLLAKYVV